MATVTIIMPVSRPDYLKRIFAQLELMPCNAPSTNIVVLVDGNMQLFDLANNLVSGSKFNQKLCVFRRKGIPNHGSVRARRKRIAEIHNEFKQYVKNCDFVFSLEDDTLFPLNTLTRLLEDFVSKPYAGFITGLELGRWGWTSIGAYKVNDVYEPTTITSIADLEYTNELFMENPLVQIDAGGFYGCLIKQEHYINHEFQPFEDALGPDVEFGLALRRAGLLNYADFTIKYIHLTKAGNIEFSKMPVVQVKLSKFDGKWSTQEL